MKLKTEKQLKKSMLQTAGFLKQSTKSTNLYQRCNKKRRKVNITNISNETRVITTDPVDIRSLIRKYYEQFYTQKFDNLDKMN